MATQTRYEKPISVRVSEDEITVTFQFESISASPNDDQPWKSIEQTFDCCRLDSMRLDFRKVKYLSSVALGKIVTLSRKFKDRLEIVNLNERILEVFLITGLNRRVNIQTSDSCAA